MLWIHKHQLSHEIYANTVFEIPILRNSRTMRVSVVLDYVNLIVLYVLHCDTVSALLLILYI